MVHVTKHLYTNKTDCIRNVLVYGCHKVRLALFDTAVYNILNEWIHLKLVQLYRTDEHRAHSVTAQSIWDFNVFFRLLTRLHVWATKRNAAIVFKERRDLNMYHCQHIEMTPLFPPFNNIETKLFTLSFQVSLFRTNTCNLTCYTSFALKVSVTFLVVLRNWSTSLSRAASGCEIFPKVFSRL